MMPLLSSFVVVALAEMGDKTQLIALTLGLRYRRPWTVMLGILIATVFNHALASAVGVWGGARTNAAVLGWLLGLSFLAFGVWTLVPDRAETPAEGRRLGAAADHGRGLLLRRDGRQDAARDGRPRRALRVDHASHRGTTLGMLVADGVAVFAGARFADRVPMRLFRRVAAALFFLFGLASIAASLGWL